MSEEYEDDDFSMSVVDVAEIAFMVVVEENGDATVKGKAKPEYIVGTLRALADSIEQTGMEDE